MESTASQIVSAWDRDRITKFSESNDDILIYQRQPLKDLGETIQGARIHEYYAPVRLDNAGFEIRGGLGELRLKSRELEEDITGLVSTFLRQFRLPEARMRIEVTRTQSCPKFHCDNLHVRLVTTYHGPTTEYQHCGETSTHSAPLFSLVFLKGRRHSTHQDSVHHRSPEVAVGEKRLCVAIDY